MKIQLHIYTKFNKFLVKLDGVCGQTGANSFVFDFPSWGYVVDTGEPDCFVLFNESRVAFFRGTAGQSAATLPLPWKTLRAGQIVQIERLQLVGDPQMLARLLSTTVFKASVKDFPHKCPRCGGPAYVGFSKVECASSC